MNNFKYKLLSSLEKVFMNEEPLNELSSTTLTGLQGETISFQIAYTANCNSWSLWEFGEFSINSTAKKHITIRKVSQVPVLYPVSSRSDDNYLKKDVGLYPDLLEEIEDNEVKFLHENWLTLWVDVYLDKNLSPKTKIEINIKNEDLTINEIIELNVNIIQAQLPEQKLIHTEWFHGDCLANYYGVLPLSNEHFEIMENFIDLYVKRGINMILTPLFTPALDISEGGERTTIQLVDVFLTNGKYSFDFTKFHKWVNLCKSKGIKYFEMCHLFSQWGAKYAIKIMVNENNLLKKCFGFNSLSTDEEYVKFIRIFIKELIVEIDKLEIREITFFHISDEPNNENIENYKNAKSQVEDLLEGFTIIDALSHFEFYKHGIVKKPIVAIDSIKEFIENDTKNLWAYYCTSQSVGVSNRFIAMPSSNNRIIATQLYKFKIEGFLHWGFNFYNSAYSKTQINPYADTCAGISFQAGDAFLVYPKKNKMPQESIRLMVFFEALQDLRAFNLLEQLTSRENVLSLIEENCETPLQFDEYPKTSSYVLELREKVNNAIMNALA